MVKTYEGGLEYQERKEELVAVVSQIIIEYADKKRTPEVFDVQSNSLVWKKISY
jgi:hypothetical protein